MLIQIILIKMIFKNCALFTDCIKEINNIQVDNAKYINIVMPMYNLIEYSDDCSKTSGSLWQYCEDIPAVNNNGVILLILMGLLLLIHLILKQKEQARLITMEE